MILTSFEPLISPNPTDFFCLSRSLTTWNYNLKTSILSSNLLLMHSTLMFAIWPCLLLYRLKTAKTNVSILYQTYMPSTSNIFWILPFPVEELFLLSIANIPKFFWTCSFLYSQESYLLNYIYIIYFIYVYLLYIYTMYFLCVFYFLNGFSPTYFKRAQVTFKQKFLQL